MSDVVENPEIQALTLRYLRESTITASSRTAYRQSQSRFLAYCLSHHPSVVKPSFRVKLGDLPTSSSSLARKIKQNLTTEECPVNFEEISSDIFGNYLLSLRKKNGERPSLATYLTHRTALFDLYRTYRMKMPDEMQLNLHP